MTSTLSVGQIALLCSYAIGMAGGQLLFKAASARLPAAQAPAGERILGLATNGYLLAALVLYFALSLLWVWVLSFTPLSRAYPFAAVAFVITPLLGGLVFGEPLSLRLLVGIAVIFCGLFLVAQ